MIEQALATAILCARLSSSSSSSGLGRIVPELCTLEQSSLPVELLGRYTPSQEVYSIDESFIRLPSNRREAVAAAREIRVAMRKLIGIPVSIGIAPSKTLAKLANRGSKSETSLGGVCHLGAYGRDQLSGLLGSIDVGDVWGVGRKMAAKYVGLGIRTALDGSIGMVLRKGDGIEVRATGGRRYVVTIDDAATGAALLATLAGRAR